MIAAIQHQRPASRGRIVRPPPLRALSIRQPWVHAILGEDDAGRPIGKRLENRDWAGCNLRGTFLIHASKTCTRAAYQDGAAAIVDVLRLEGRAVTVPPLAELPQGGIVGIARIVGAKRNPPAWDIDGRPRGGMPQLCPCQGTGHRPDRVIDLGPGSGDAVACSKCGGTGILGGWLRSKGWAVATALGLQLADCRGLEFVPYKGARGFFPVALRELPIAYHVAADELDQAERQRLRPSARGLWLLRAAAGNGTGLADDRRPGLVAVPAELVDEADRLKEAGLLVDGPEPHLAQITTDGLRAMKGAS